MTAKAIESLKDYNWIEELNVGFGKKKDYANKLDELNNIINELASDYMSLEDRIEDIRRMCLK